MPYHTGIEKKKKKRREVRREVNVPVNKALYSRVKQRLNVNSKFIRLLMLMRGLYESNKSVVVLTEWKKNVARSSGGLTRWFKENWVDVKTGKPCGRSKGEKRGYPACRPKKRVSSKTPKTVGEMTAAEKARFKREKTGSKKITYQHRRKTTRKKKK